MPRAVRSAREQPGLGQRPGDEHQCRSRRVYQHQECGDRVPDNPRPQRGNISSSGLLSLPSHDRYVLSTHQSPGSTTSTSEAGLPRIEARLGPVGDMQLREDVGGIVADGRDWAQAQKQYRRCCSRSDRTPRSRSEFVKDRPGRRRRPRCCQEVDHPGATDDQRSPRHLRRPLRPDDPGSSRHHEQITSRNGPNRRGHRRRDVRVGRDNPSRCLDPSSPSRSRSRNGRATGTAPHHRTPSRTGVHGYGPRRRLSDRGDPAHRGGRGLAVRAYRCTDSWELLGVGVGAFVVTGALAGRKGVVDLARRGVRWRVPVRWYLVALFTVPVGATLISLAIYGSRALASPPSGWPRALAEVATVFLLQLVR